MKLISNINLATINTENGLDSALVFTARDKKVMSAIGHGINAVMRGVQAYSTGCVTYGCVKVAADKVEDPGTRVLAGGMAVPFGMATAAYGRAAYTEACKAVTYAKEAMQTGK